MLLAAETERYHIPLYIFNLVFFSVKMVGITEFLTRRQTPGRDKNLF